MATNSKKTAKYDLKAADRRRNLAVQIGLTSVVVIFAVALVLYIVMTKEDKPSAGEAKSIRVTSSKLVTKEGGEPKAVLSMYEDFLCPHCAEFEKQFGPTVRKLIDTGAVAADYYMVAILDRPQNQNYSSRAGGAAYCVADESIQAFQVFHDGLFTNQPSETSAVYPDNKRLIEMARLAGVVGTVPDCINKGTYDEMVGGMAEATGIQATPTVRINGEEYKYTTPDALIAKIKEIVGDVPGLDAMAPTPAPAPAPAP